MRPTRSRWPSRLLVLAALAAAMLPAAPIHGGPVVCEGMPPAEGTLDTPVDTFVVYRPGQFRVHLRYRDLEFMLDTLYASSPTLPVQQTLERFAHTMVDSAGQNPFGVNASYMQLIYDYFKHVTQFYNPIDPKDSTSLVVGASGAGQPIPGYNNIDRSHVDVFIAHPSHITVGGRPTPDRFSENNEDRSTGNDLNPKHKNSLAIKGPHENLFIDTLGTGWTRPGTIQTMYLNHEFQHLLPGEPGGIPSEMMSAGAEAVAGNRDTVHVDDVAYTWSLNGSGGITGVRSREDRAARGPGGPERPHGRAAPAAVPRSVRGARGGVADAGGCRRGTGRGAPRDRAALAARGPHVHGAGGGGGDRPRGGGQPRRGLRAEPGHRRSSRGEAVPAGVYFYRMDSGAFRAERKMVVLP
jgi:hypothetical protein